MLADTIKEIRKKHYLNQAAFAKMIGVTQSAVSQWENDLTRPNSYQLEAIATAFNISIDELLVDNIKETTPGAPKTPEARLLAKGVDMMPETQRKAIIDMMSGLYPGVFEKGVDDNDT